jgi:hypothetical protein
VPYWFRLCGNGLVVRGQRRGEALAEPTRHRRRASPLCTLRLLRCNAAGRGAPRFALVLVQQLVQLVGILPMRRARLLLLLLLPERRCLTRMARRLLSMSRFWRCRQGGPPSRALTRLSVTAPRSAGDPDGRSPTPGLLADRSETNPRE